MRGENLEGRADFKVVCAWCGGLIRHSTVKDSRRMRPRCYARLLDEYLRPRRAPSAPRASER